MLFLLYKSNQLNNRVTHIKIFVLIFLEWVFIVVGSYVVIVKTKASKLMIIRNIRYFSKHLITVKITKTNYQL